MEYSVKQKVFGEDEYTVQSLGNKIVSLCLRFLQFGLRMRLDVNGAR